MGFCFYEDGVTGARFTLLSETITEADKIYGAMFSDIEHQTAQDSDP